MSKLPTVGEMNEELINKDGYPLESTLAKVREWPWEDPFGLFAFMQSIWYLDSWGWREKDGRGYAREAERRFSISTAGWSGNESIIQALEENTMVWALFWFSSRRGGHYEFRVPRAIVKTQTSGADFLKAADEAITPLSEEAFKEYLSDLEET